MRNIKDEVKANFESSRDFAAAFSVWAEETYGVDIHPSDSGLSKDLSNENLTAHKKIAYLSFLDTLSKVENGDR
jgi:hypothetical protein